MSGSESPHHPLICPEAHRGIGLSRLGVPVGNSGEFSIGAIGLDKPKMIAACECWSEASIAERSAAIESEIGGSLRVYLSKGVTYRAG